MSSDSDANITSAFSALIFGDYWACAATALGVYDYILTLKYEVDLLWRQKWSTAAWIFVLNRYLLLVYAVFALAPVSPQLCINSAANNLIWFVTGGDLLKLPLHGVTIARVFALLQGPWKLLASSLLMILCMFVFISDTFLVFVEVWAYVFDPVMGPSCYQSGFTVYETTVVRLTTAAAIISIAQGAIALGVTLFKTFHQVRHAPMVSVTTSLSQVLLRDGSILFLVFLISDILDAVPTLNESAFSDSVSYALSLAFTVYVGKLHTRIFLTSISVPHIILSQFIINLRQASCSTSNSSLYQFSTFISLSFRMPTVEGVLGNIGESFDFTEHDIDGNADATGTHRGGLDIEAIEDTTNYDISERTGTLDAFIHGSSTRALPDTINLDIAL